jgi:hypothetical protein
VAVLAVLTLALAACSAGQASTPAPAKATSASAPATASSAPSSSPAAATRRAAIAAYRAFWPAGDRAERSGHAGQARAILAGYATPAWIQVMVTGMAPFWRRHEVARGRMIDHVESARVLTGAGRNPAAFIVDCQDASHHAVASATSGKIVPGSAGPAHAQLAATLIYRHGRWLIRGITFKGNQC